LACLSSSLQNNLLTTTGPDQLRVRRHSRERNWISKVGRAAGARKARWSRSRRATLTDYIRGGVTVFGAKKDFPAFCR